MPVPGLNYYVPTIEDATHVLDGKELVARVRPATEITDRIIDNAADESEIKPFIYPQIDREKMFEHGLFLINPIPRNDDDFNGDLLVTGDRLMEGTDLPEEKGGDS